LVLKVQNRENFESRFNIIRFLIFRYLTKIR